MKMILICLVLTLSLLSINVVELASADIDIGDIYPPYYAGLHMSMDGERWVRRWDTMIAVKLPS